MSEHRPQLSPDSVKRLEAAMQRVNRYAYAEGVEEAGYGEGPRLTRRQARLADSIREFRELLEELSTAPPAGDGNAER